ncbi:MAG: ribonuclease inhibitor [Acidobacteriota bacterium]
MMETAAERRSNQRHAAFLASAAVLALSLTWASPEIPAPWSGVGRLHPVVVHFPIAFLTFAAFLDLWASARPLFRAASRLLWLAGMWSGILALLVGHLLSQTGSWEPVLLARHRWAAVGLLAAGIAALALRAWRPSLLWRRLTAVPVLLLVGWTGHGGGTLTHGPGYLTAWWRFGAEDPGAQELGPLTIFGGVVQPILADQCVSCHGAGRAEGGLRLDSYEAVLQGGEDGPVLVEGRPEASEIYRRVTLPPADPERMPPPQQPPLGVGETELLRWWISLGASAELQVGEVRPDQMPSAVRTALTRRGRLGPADPLAGLQPVGPLPAGSVESLVSRGIRVRRVAADHPFLEVDLSGRAVATGDLDALAPLAEHVVWLNLSGSRLEPEAWGRLEKFSNLQRLWLDRSNVSSADLAVVRRLAHLSYLNLYGTAVTDKGLEPLAELPKLSNLYLWQTLVTGPGIQALAPRSPRLKVDMGIPAQVPSEHERR